MWMVLLYGVATFMETGVGVWMFGRMFPERKSSSEYRWVQKFFRQSYLKVEVAGTPQ